MTIRFHLPVDAIERVAFAYSPVLEEVLSLHVLVEPKHHAIQHPWVRRARRLSQPLRREIDAFGFAFRAYFPEFLFPRPNGEFPSFESELGALSALPLDLVALEFSRPLTGGMEPRNPARLRQARTRSAMLSAADGLPTASKPLIRLLLEDPGRLLERFQALLSNYWEAAFCEEWERLEPGFAEAVTEVGQSIADRGLYAILGDLRPEVRVDPASGTFWLDRSHEHVVEVGEDPIVFVPSVYVWPHVRINCDPPWPLGLVYPAPSTIRAAKPEIPPDHILRVLRALADDTRLRALKLIGQRPRSTQELAPLVWVSPAALSKHLRTLTDAGILRSHREGYYVLYELVPDRLDKLSSSITAFLDEQ
jgi:DNA-binding transcriptional ArsR family regulator